ncbi:hypothetical protein [Amphibacillus sediminis]|uniref:hypothetical protein n=1 Tax=Amphibacillus sediminis TaxID=360185 RepID=UPI000832C4E8|nr:hypothetical protein [Amphibacillus sediminis]
MIEINFFEQKKKNSVPYLLLAVAIISSLVLVSYLIIATKQLNSQYTDNLSRIKQQEKIVAEIEQINLMADQVSKLSAQLDQLEQNKFPTIYLYDAIQSVLLKHDATILSHFHYSLGERLYISLQLEGLDRVAELDRALLQLAYINSVELELIELTNEDKAYYQAEMKIEINHNGLLEVMSDGD